MTARDAAQGRVYAAEQSVRLMVDRGAPVVLATGEAVEVPPDRKFGRVEDVAGYLAALWSGLDLPGPVPQVRTRRGAAAAHWEQRGNVIAVPDTRWALRELVVLHEAAHALTWTVHRATGHGPAFCREHADLVRRVNPHVGLVLTDAFHTAGLMTG